MWKLARNFGILLSLILIYKPLDRWTEKYTRLFTTCAISSHVAPRAEWDIPPPSPEKVQELNTALAQPFTFFKAGGQAYAFLSEDKKYVLKVFKMYRYRLPLGLSSLSLPSSLETFRDRFTQKKNDRLNHNFASYHLAYSELAAETGLIFAHLNPTPCIHQSVKLIDNIGIAHTIDLDQTPFILQRYMTPTFVAFEAFIQEGKWEELKQSIDKLIELAYSRYQKGIFDGDAVLRSNYGFYDGNAAILDIGRLKKSSTICEQDVYSDDLPFLIKQLRSWAEEKCPDLLVYIDEKRYDP
jgi:hypothetical protein